MTEQDQLIEFARRWSKMNAAHIQQRVLQWKGHYGLLFVGDDSQAGSAIEFMQQRLRADKVLQYDNHKKAEWREETEFLLEKNHQLNLLEPLPSRVCIVTKDLDRAPDWLFYKLKFLFEHALGQVILLATATDSQAIPDLLSSHYYIFHATKNRRKLSEAYKALPPRSDTGQVKAEEA